MTNKTTGLRIEGLEGLQTGGDTAADQFYQASARNKASQCQASLVGTIAVQDEGLDVDKLLSSPQVAEEIVNAYYTRLLENTVGVQPQGAVLQSASDALGLTKHNVEQHTRVVGGALQVAGTAPQPSPPSGLPAAQVQLFDALFPVIKQEQSTDIAGSHEVKDLLRHQEDGNRFAEYVRLYTYPYNKQQKLSKSTPAEQQQAAKAAQITVLQQQWNKMCTAEKRTVSEVCPGAAATVAAATVAALAGQLPEACKPARRMTLAAAQEALNQVQADRPHVEEGTSEQLRELTQDFLVTAALIQSYHASFAQQMSEYLTANHQQELDRWGITAGDVAAFGELLQTAAVTRLSLTLVYYLYTRWIAGSNYTPAQLLHSKLPADRKTKHAKRPTVAGAKNGMNTAAGSPVAAAADDSGMPDKWDMGCQLLLQKKADEAAEQQRQEAAAAATAAEKLAQRQALLPPCTGKSRRQVASVSPLQARCPSSTGSDDMMAASSSSPGTRRGPSNDNGELIRQESSCSSGTRSRASFAGSMASYKQAVEAAQHQAHLIASATISELQSCRLSGMLQTWDDLVSKLSRSTHSNIFALPSLLLSLQVLVRELFSDTFHLWSRSKQGGVVLQQMTATVPVLLDPQQNYNTLMVLAGSPAAVAVRQMCDAGPLVGVDKRRRQAGLSSTVAAAVGQPSSPSLRRMVHAAGSGPSKHAAAADVALGAELVHAAAAHRMTQLVRRK